MIPRDNPQLRNILALSLLAFLSAVQCWLAVAVFVWNKAPVNALVQEVYPEWQALLRPEHEAAIYHGLILSALAGQAALIYIFRHKLSQAGLWEKLKWLLGLDAVVTALMLDAIFQAVVYAPRSQLAHQALAGLLAATVLYKAAWPWMPRVTKIKMPWPLKIWPDAVTLGIIVLLLYTPDPTAIAARIFLGEQFHHFDGMVTTPAWAFLSGATLNLDVISQYGLGCPIVIGWLCRLVGGFSYASCVEILMLGTVLYFILWYVFLRGWIKDKVLCAAAIILGISTQMFHTGDYPIAFTYPDVTVWRFLWDVVFFLALQAYWNNRRGIFLAVAGAVAGLAVFHVTTTGLCLALTLAVVMIADAVVVYRQGHTVRWGFYAAGLVAAAGVFAAFLMVFIGKAAWSAEFWHNMNEFNNYFLSGFGVVPMDDALRQRQLFAGFLGFAIPVLYAAGILISGSALLFFRPQTKWVMVMAMSSYGFLLFHYYIARSVAANVFVVALPAVFLVFYALAVALPAWPKIWQRRGAWSILGLAVFTLATNHNFIDYPNVLNVSRNPMVDPRVFGPLPDGRSYFNHLYSQLPMSSRLPLNSLGETDEQLKTEKDFAGDAQLKDYYRKEFDFSQDAALIDRLVPANRKAAVVSSFETKILMQAHRQPFFYYVPVIISRLMRMRTFPVTALYTTGEFQRTIAQIEEDKPEYIFIEKIFKSKDIALATYKDGSAFLALMHFIEAHYQTYAQGRFLMALKREK